MSNSMDRYDVYFVKLLIENYRLKGADKVAIFGAGRNGVKIANLINESGYQVDCFIDNNAAIANSYANGIPILHVSSVGYLKSEMVVFVSPYESESIYAQLKSLMYVNVVEKQALAMLRILPSFDSTMYLSQMPSIGHYYSLYPDFEEIDRRSSDIFSNQKEILDIELNENSQLEFLKAMTSMYGDLPSWKTDNSDPGYEYRYYLGNPSLSYGDAVALHCMMRILKPNRWVEVGSGFTSAVVLDTNEFYLSHKTNLTFIEPYPHILHSVLKMNDAVNLIEKKLQDVPLSEFMKLDSGDVLFIDSTHVSKVGSDVNYLFFEIFPILKAGVIIHIHDIFYPFEYPKEWILSGRCWNELYMLRAFLQNNNDYEIVYFQNMLEKKHYEVFQDYWESKADFHGGSFWMRKMGCGPHIGRNGRGVCG